MHRRQFLGAMLGTVALPYYARAQAPRELRLGSVNVTGSVQDKGLQKLVQVVETESKGRYKVKVYMDSQLGDLGALLSGMQLGTIDMALLGIGNAAGLKGGAALNIGYVPYLFKSKTAARDILSGPLFADMFETLAKEFGVRAFAVAGARSPRAIQTIKGPIVKPADLKDVRLRIPPIDIFRATFEALGVKPVALGANEIYLAMSRGQVDGQDNGLDVSLPFKWHEVAKYWSATDHVYELGTYYMSEKLWQSLPAEDREIFRKAGLAAGDEITKLTEDIDRGGVEELKKAGVTYTVPDIAAFRDALKNVHEPFEGKAWPAGLVAKIRAMQA